MDLKKIFSIFHIDGHLLSSIDSMQGDAIKVIQKGTAIIIYLFYSCFCLIYSGKHLNHSLVESTEILSFLSLRDTISLIGS